VPDPVDPEQETQLDSELQELREQVTQVRAECIAPLWGCAHKAMGAGHTASFSGMEGVGVLGAMHGPELAVRIDSVVCCWMELQEVQEVRTQVCAIEAWGRAPGCYRVAARLIGGCMSPGSRSHRCTCLDCTRRRRLCPPYGSCATADRGCMGPGNRSQEHIQSMFFNWGLQAHYSAGAPSASNARGMISIRVERDGPGWLRALVQ
jgi:hypothetical protein